MTNPSIGGVGTTGNYYNWGYPYLYNPSMVDMESSMATGYNPTSPIDMSYDYGLFNSMGYNSPYNLGYDSFSYSNPMMYGMMNPAMTQAMVQSQAMMLDGQRVIDGKKRDMKYDGQIQELKYQTVLKDAQDTNHEDIVRRDTNFKAVCDKINERLEAKDTAAALREYHYAISLMATVYDDVDAKRLEETPSGRAAVKAAFERKYQEVYGKSFKDKIDECLPGSFGSGFDSVWKMQNVMSAEEMKSFVDDRNIAFKEKEETYKTFGKITGGLAHLGAIVVGTATGATVGTGIGALLKNTATKTRRWKGGGIWGAIIGGGICLGCSAYQWFKTK